MYWAMMGGIFCLSTIPKRVIFHTHYLCEGKQSNSCCVITELRSTKVTLHVGFRGVGEVSGNHPSSGLAVHYCMYSHIMYLCVCCFQLILRAHSSKTSIAIIIFLFWSDYQTGHCHATLMVCVCVCTSNASNSTHM